VKQSDQRVAGRTGVPPSFGRSATEPPREEEFRVVGGQAFMTLNVDVVPSAESLAALYEQVKATVAAAIRDAYAETVGAALAEPPPGVDGGSSGG
jgi:hypothetical protein